MLLVWLSGLSLVPLLLMHCVLCAVVFLCFAGFLSCVVFDVVLSSFRDLATRVLCFNNSFVLLIQGRVYCVLCLTVLCCVVSLISGRQLCMICVVLIFCALCCDILCICMVLRCLHHVTCCGDLMCY